MKSAICIGTTSSSSFFCGGRSGPYLRLSHSLVQRTKVEHNFAFFRAFEHNLPGHEVDFVDEIRLHRAHDHLVEPLKSPGQFTTVFERYFIKNKNNTILKMNVLCAVKISVANPLVFFLHHSTHQPLSNMERFLFDGRKST